MSRRDLDASSRSERYKTAMASRPKARRGLLRFRFATTLERTPFEYRPDTPDYYTFLATPGQLCVKRDRHESPMPTTEGHGGRVPTQARCEEREVLAQLR